MKDREICEAAILGNMKSTTDILLAKAKYDQLFPPQKVLKMLDRIEELEKRLEKSENCGLAISRGAWCPCWEDETND